MKVKQISLTMMVEVPDEETDAYPMEITI